MIRSVRRAAVLLVVPLISLGLLAEPGADVFSMKCANCHGKDGAGKTSFAQKATLPDLRSQAVQAKSDRELHDGIGRGIGHKQYPHAYLMRGMTESELNSVVAYIRTLK